MGKRLRVLVVGSAWPPETFIERLLRGLLARGVHITVTARKRPAPEWLAIPGFSWLPVSGWAGPPVLRVIGLSMQFARGWFRANRDVRLLSTANHTAPEFGEQLRYWHRLLPYVGKRWDVIYFPWNSAATGHLPLFDLGMPVVLSCRGSQINVAPHSPARPEFREGLRRTFDRAAIVHCVSQQIVEQAVHWGLDPSKCRVIHPAVNIGFFCPPNQRTENKRYVLLTTGSLHWVKGYEYGLLSLRRLLDAGINCELHIIGEGTERQRILFTIDDLGLREHVVLHGRLSPADVRARLQSADAFLLASLSEGISNAVLEAMACGLPVVTTDCGGMREAVTDGVEGFVTPVRDPGAMAQALQTLWREPDLRRSMGEAAHQRVLREFDERAQLDRWLALFESLQRGAPESLQVEFSSGKAV